MTVIVKQLSKDKDETIKKLEMNKEVGVHRWTPLYRAGRRMSIALTGRTRTLKGVSVHSVMHDCNKEIIELLLANGANVDCEDRSTGTTALQMAIIRGNLLSTQTLVARGADTRALSKVRDASLTTDGDRRSILGGR